MIKKKLFGVNLDIKLKEKFDAVAHNRYMSASALLNQLMAREVAKHYSDPLNPRRLDELKTLEEIGTFQKVESEE